MARPLRFPEERDGQIKPGDVIATLRERAGIAAGATPGVQQPRARSNPCCARSVAMPAQSWVIGRVMRKS